MVKQLIQLPPKQLGAGQLSVCHVLVLLDHGDDEGGHHHGWHGVDGGQELSQ